MLTDSRIPPEFEAVKDRDEKIFWSAGPTLVPFLLSGVPFLMVGVLWGAIDYFGFIQNMPQEQSTFFTLFFILHMFPLWGSVLNMLRLILVYKNTKYAYTNKRLMMRSGFFGIDFKSIDYDKISDIEVNVNPVENLFGAGTIRAFSGRVNNKGGQIYDKFIAIQNPYEVFKNIKEISVDVKTDWNYPNALRPKENPGYKSGYTPRSK